jgi:archaellum component FlaC
MKNNLSKIFAVLAAFLVIAALADTNYAQRRVQRAVYSRQQVEQLLERIEERTDAFSNQLNKSLDRSRLDGTRSEDNIAERVSELENATDELRREYDHNDTRGENRPEAQKILNTATEVNRIMNIRNFSNQAENSWVRLRMELNTLARVYGLPSVGAKSYRFVAVRNTAPIRNTLPVRRATIIRTYSQQQVEELLERIEERSDDFTNQLNKSLDRSRLNGSRSEDNIAELARDLGDATDELRREFDHNDTRGENLPEAQRIIGLATNINGLMRSRNFGGQTESTWSILRSELNTLAGLYGLKTVGSSSSVVTRNTTPIRTTVPVRRSSIIRSYTQQQVEQLLERIEERTDAFSNQLNKSLDRSRLDGTRSEDNIAERSSELENATDELRREFDHNDTRGENKPEAEKVLITATAIDRLMRSRNFGGQTESTWIALRSELNILARLYGLSAVGSKTYR